MKMSILKHLYPFLAKFVSDGWGEELNVSFKRAVMNDVKNHQWRLVAIPMSLVTTVIMTIGGLVFLIYGASTWFITDIKAAEVALITGGSLLLLAAISLAVLVANLRFILSRVEDVQESMLRVRETAPLQELYHQFKEEQRMFLEALHEHKQKRSSYEPDNISVV